MSFAGTRVALAAAGVLDLSATSLLACAYYARADEVTFLAALALSLQSLHAFTWFGYLVASSGEPSSGFARMMLAANAAAGILDLASLLARALVVGVSDSLGQISAWATGGMLFADALAAFALRVYLRAERRGDSDSDSDSRSELKGREPAWATELRERALAPAWALELGLVAAQLGLHALGLNRSAAYSRLILLEVPHAFLWLLHRAAVGSLFGNGGGVRSRGWLWLGALATSGALALGVAAAALRLTYYFTEADGAVSAYAGVPEVWGWVQFGVGLALVLVAAVQVAGLGVLQAA
jgi:hypothetical protein